VVDFIDVGVGTLRWPTFNVADTAVTCGALVLAAVLWQEGRQPTGRQEQDGATVTS
jgi:signal peptidase II